MVRDALIASLASSVTASPAVQLVAIDGVDGAGKTVLADELGRAVEALGRPVVRSSVDGFHHSSRIRYRRGRTSPEGYFQDSYDYAALRRVLLTPLRDDRPYRRSVYDYKRDEPVNAPEEQAAAGAILVLDGIFLHRPELVVEWDFSIFLQVDFAVTFARMSTRDGCDPNPEAPTNRRYLDGQKLYLTSCHPADAASVIIDNNDIQRPRVLGDALDHAQLQQVRRPQV